MLSCIWVSNAKALEIERSVYYETCDACAISLDVFSLRVVLCQSI